MVYLIGSLRNPVVPETANKLRVAGYEVFDDWYAAGEEADDKWRDYEKGRGHSYIEALRGHAAGHVFEYDKEHLTRAEHVILVLPGGRSAHLELGWAIGRGKRSYVILDSYERWDVMYKFVDGVVYTVEELIETYLRGGTVSSQQQLGDGVEHPEGGNPGLGGMAERNGLYMPSYEYEVLSRSCV